MFKLNREKPPFNDGPSNPRSVFFRKRYAVFFVLIGIVGLICFLIFRQMLPDNSPLSQGPAAGKVVDVVDIYFDNPAALKDWREYVFNKKSEYKVELDPNREMVLHASSRGSYSTIFKTVNIPLAARPILAWQWRVRKFPSHKKYQSLGAVNENDFAIRICAIFAKNNPLSTEVVQYLWDDYFPVGAHVPSPYSKNVRMLVVESGKPASSEEWFTEKRDLLDDYEKLFGKTRFSDLKAIAIISNSDDTQTESEAFVKRIWIESEHAERLHRNQHWIRDNIRNLTRSLHSLKRFRLSTLKRHPVPFYFLS